MSKKYWIYHKKECPLGKIVDELEYESLLKKKWVKNPNEFSSTTEPEKSKSYLDVPESVYVARGTETVAQKIEA